LKIDRAEVAAALAPGLLLALVPGGAAALLAATLAPEERAALWALVEPRIALVAMVWFFAALAGGWALRGAWLRFGAAPARLAERLQVQLAGDGERTLDVSGSAGSRALAAAVNALLEQRTALRTRFDARVAEASRQVEQEKSRLAALMAELTQSVVVCNLEGRILLFNARARLQLRTLGAAASQAGAPAIGGSDGAGPVALGRSVYAVLDRRLVAHALEAVQQRLARGAANPSAQFVTGTQSGQLLRVQMAPVREPGAAAGAPLNGFVLMLDNVTRDLAEADERDRLLEQLTEGSRSAVGNLQAAVELLDDPELDAPTRERFLGVIREEIGKLAARIDEASRASAAALRTRWPLEDMLGADLAAAAARRIEAAAESRVALGEIDGTLWLKVESFSVIQALLHLALRLEQAFGSMRLRLELAPSVQTAGRAQLDLVLPVHPMSTETVIAWETEPLEGERGPGPGALTLRDVVQRHGGAFWFERDRPRQRAVFRFLLPLADAAVPLEAAAVVKHDSRPEFYDFDLFAAAQGADLADLGQRALRELAFTVFDTETTGLEPSRGDKIIQIGATRVVAGKPRRQDAFEQLVDPERSLPEAGIAVHGIRPEMLRGQPPITSVLPAFHAFAADSVLVAHNAAFDMRFLQLAEPDCGVHFTMPVLDTLLLSAVLHPNQESHRLEAIAERLGVPVLGRHTALGDAIVTAEVFARMIPLLEAAGIRTLAQALEASRETYLARVSY
jgi:DNA polymerase-3 subunit epsilon